MLSQLDMLIYQMISTVIRMTMIGYQPITKPRINAKHKNDKNVLTIVALYL